MAELKTPSLKRNFFYRTIYQILTVIVPFITTPYLSRVLGSEQIGIQSFTESIMAYFSMFALLGTSTYGTREVARVRDDKETYSKLFWEIEILQFITGTVVLAGWIFFTIFSHQYKVIYIVLTIELLSVIFEITWFFTAFEHLGIIVLRNGLIKIANLVLIFIFVKKEQDLLKYILITSISKFVSSVCTYGLLPKYLCRVKLTNLWKHMGHHLKETMVYFIPTISTSIYRVLDKVLIGQITQNPNENGYYEQAEKLVNMVKQIVFYSINSVVGVRTNYLFAKGLFAEVKEKIDFTLNYIFALGIACSLGIIAVAKRFVPVFFGPGYDDVIRLLYIFSPMAIICGISNCLDSHYYNPIGKRLQSAIYIVIGAVTNLCLNLILIPKFQAFGAAVATCIAETIITVLFVLRCDQYTSFRKILRISWKKILAGATMFACIKIIDYFCPLSNLYSLIIEIISGGIIYCGILLLLKDQWIKMLITKVIEKFFKMKKTNPTSEKNNTINVTEETVFSENFYDEDSEKKKEDS